jgi:hypothetical protein
MTVVCFALACHFDVFGFFSAAKSWQAFPANQEGNFGLWGLKNLVVVLFNFFMPMELKKSNACFYVCGRGFVRRFHYSIPF